MILPFQLGIPVPDNGTPPPYSEAQLEQNWHKKNGYYSGNNQLSMYISVQLAFNFWSQDALIKSSPLYTSLATHTQNQV